MAEARKAAESEGVVLKELITLAVAEKVSAMRTEEYFEERARHADPARVSRILARVAREILSKAMNSRWSYLPGR